MFLKIRSLQDVLGTSRKNTSTLGPKGTGTLLDVIGPFEGRPEEPYPLQKLLSICFGDNNVPLLAPRILVQRRGIKCRVDSTVELWKKIAVEKFMLSKKV